MVLRLYGHLISPFAQKVLIMLIETETPYEFVHVDFIKGEQNAPAHLAKNPFGAVPYMVSALYTWRSCDI
jgi:glutathione S-transferase